MSVRNEHSILEHSSMEHSILEHSSLEHSILEHSSLAHTNPTWESTANLNHARDHRLTDGLMAGGHCHLFAWQ